MVNHGLRNFPLMNAYNLRANVYAIQLQLLVHFALLKASEVRGFTQWLVNFMSFSLLPLHTRSPSWPQTYGG